jgi:hypothetical protein
MDVINPVVNLLMVTLLGADKVKWAVVMAACNCYSWWRWWSDTLVVTLTRLWLHSLSCCHQSVVDFPLESRRDCSTKFQKSEFLFAYWLDLFRVWFKRNMECLQCRSQLKLEWKCDDSLECSPSSKKYWMEKILCYKSMNETESCA